MEIPFVTEMDYNWEEKTNGNMSGTKTSMQWFFPYILRLESLNREDWEKPNSPMMCVDHGVRLGEAQFSSGGVTYSQRLVNVKWVAPMDKHCMTIRPVLD
ncbi:hypothetical protein Bca4012_044070 [Brassica carinata]